MGADVASPVPLARWRRDPEPNRRGPSADRERLASGIPLTPRTRSTTLARLRPGQQLLRSRRRLAGTGASGYSAARSRSSRNRCSRRFISSGMGSRPTSPVSSRVLR